MAISISFFKKAGLHLEDLERMISVDIPGRGKITLKNLVLDFNGTLALDGKLLPGVKERLEALSKIMDIYIITADTFGTVRSLCSEIKAKVEILKEPLGAREKLKFLKKLNAAETAAIGNGSNDSLMLAGAALGIMVLGPEGASAKALLAADALVSDINHGLDLLLNTARLVATLRG